MGKLEIMERDTVAYNGKVFGEEVIFLERKPEGHFWWGM